LKFKNIPKYLDLNRKEKVKEKKSIHVWAWSNRAPTGRFGVRRSAHAPLWAV
jgi:hypothetical protein